MAKHGAPPRTTPESVGPRLGRNAMIGAEQVRSTLGANLVAGDVLPTGVILQVTHNEIDGEVRCEMPGAEIHYVDYRDTVTVLARVDRAVLDGISVGTFLARSR